MDTFSCEEPVEFSYHSAHVNLLARALNQSMKICIRITTEGFLGVQVMMPMPQNLPIGDHYGILEFKVSHFSHCRILADYCRCFP